MEKLRRKFEKYKKGFTLAEVLITLVIVGVVAALTIPNLINKTNHKEYASKLKKAYSILQQFVHASAMQKGEPQGDYSFFNNYDFINEFAKTVNVAKKCDILQECFATENYSGNLIYYNKLNNQKETFIAGKTVITSDGILYNFSNDSLLSPYNYGISTETYTKFIGRIIVDVNGPKKPNTVGIDTFIFYLVNPAGVVPAGIENVSGCGKNQEGKTCAAKVLRDGDINYL